ncbi:MAG TPA: alpha/beta fold hydrolase [Solirubrobacteraceae bacterium]
MEPADPGQPVGMDARTGFVEANDLTFGTLEWGPSRGPLVLCLHGYPDTAWTWRYVAPLLAERGHRVVAPFQRGYAPTSLADDYSVRSLAADAVALRRALAHGGEPVVLVGHDWGAAAAYLVDPGAFDRIVTIAVPPPAVLLRVTPLLAVRQVPRSWYMAFQQVPVLSERSLDWLAPALWRTWSPGYDPAQDLEHLRAAWPTNAHRSAALAYYRALHRIRPSDVRDALTPDAYLHGADDGAVLADLARRADGAIVVPGAGHFVQLEQPDVVARHIVP